VQAGIKAMTKRPSIAEIVDTLSIGNAMLICALEQAGMLAEVDFAKQLRGMAEAEGAPKGAKKRKNQDFHILRHVASLIEMHREIPSKKQRKTATKSAGRLLIAQSP
jgi:hypothetical protein